MNPIIISEGDILVGGERRLESCKIIKPDYLVPCRYIENMPEHLQLVEFEENAKRKNLTWEEASLAVHKIHTIKTKSDPTWNTSKTGEMLGYAQQHISKLLAAAEGLINGNSGVTQAQTLSQAVSIISRQAKREEDNFLNSLLEPTQKKDQDSPFSIQESNFIEWSAHYEGPKFNLMHCDFPYGVNHEKSAQGGTASGRWDGYADSEDVYWKLLSTFADNIDNFMLPSAHCMFWFSMNFYSETVAFFKEHTDLQLVTPFPLIWQKSDGRGIVPDVARRPRQIYETALLLSRGDRSIIKPVGNACYLPSQKSSAIHVSEKPEDVLKYFFQLFVDNETILLDPTCGSGSAIRAAKAMGAKQALGLEINPDFAKDAQNKLRQVQFINKLSDDIIPKEQE